MKAGMTRSVVIGVAAAALSAGWPVVVSAQDTSLGGLLGAMGTAEVVTGADVRRSNEAKAAVMDKVAPEAAVNQAPQAMPEAAPADPDAAATAPAEALPDPAAVAAPATVAPYDPASHRDPFRPPNLGNVEMARTPLERYQIGQLKLVGVVWDQGAGAPRAMVEDSAGLGYIVSAGTAIGSSGGVVRSIEPRRVLIEETVTNFYGEKEPKEIVMALPEEDRSP